MTPAPPARPRRSALYVPGSNARALQKAASLPVDVLILDLEDAVLPGAKAGAREAVCAAVRARGFGAREVVIRVNGGDTGWGAEDLRAAATSGADAVLLPKVESRDTVLAAARVLDELAPATQRLWAMAETPRGVLALAGIATAHPRLAAIVVGTADLGRALRLPAPAPRWALVPALAHCLLAARAAGLDILDGVCTRLGDPSVFRAECLEGRQLGFDGKTLIHPEQIDACNEIFGVSDAEAAAAADLIAAWRAAAAAGAGVAVHAGRLVERLHVEEAERLVALHRTIRQQAAP
jgi:citrate lyase subunit beta/citryl-CoA lyase